MIHNKVYDTNGVYIGGNEKFINEEYDCDENKEQRNSVLLVAGCVGTGIFLTILYFLCQLSGPY